MATHDDERFTELQELVIGAFEYIRALLRELPVPVRIEGFSPNSDTTPETMMGLHRVIALLADEPISYGAKAHYERIILDWFTAYEMIVLRKLAGPAPWRLDAAEYALTRVAVIGEMIENGEVDELDES